MSQRQPFAPARPASRAARAKVEESTPARRTTDAAGDKQASFTQLQNVHSPLNRNDAAIHSLSANSNKPLKIATLGKKTAATPGGRVPDGLVQQQRQQDSFATSTKTSHDFLLHSPSPPLGTAEDPANTHIVAPMPSRSSSPFVPNGLLGGQFKTPALPTRRIDHAGERAHTSSFDTAASSAPPVNAEEGSAATGLTLLTNPGFYGANEQSDIRSNLSQLAQHAPTMYHLDEIIYDDDEQHMQLAPLRSTRKRHDPASEIHHPPDAKRSKSNKANNIQGNAYMHTIPGAAAQYHRPAVFAEASEDDATFAFFPDHPSLKPVPPRAPSTAPHRAPSAAPRARTSSVAAAPPVPKLDPIDALLMQKFHDYCVQHPLAPEVTRRWEGCTLEEWVEGANELRGMFDKALVLVTEQMTKTQEVYAEVHGLVDAHRGVLAGRQRMMEGVQRGVMRKTGNVLVVDDEVEAEG